MEAPRSAYARNDEDICVMLRLEAGGALCEVRRVGERDETARSAIFEFDDREGQPVL